MVRTYVLITGALLLAWGASADLAAKPVSGSHGYSVSIFDGSRAVFAPPGDGEITVVLPGGPATVSFERSSSDGKSTTLSGAHAGGIELSEEYRAVAPDLIERNVTAKANADQRFYIDFGLSVPIDGSFYSFFSQEPKTAAYSPGCSGPEFNADSKQTFPFLGCLSGERVYGVIGESPGLWENRSFMKFDVENRKLSLANGDGSAKRVISIPPNVDATSVYRAQFDGWQHIETGEKMSWKTWIFASPAKTQYDVQLAAHLALANAKGFNHSGLEAILRNTSYLLLRRNLLRSESDYIFISGVGYGWKQWVSDGFWMSRGLDDPKYDAEAQAAIFYERLDYEDNAQYYLIWAALVKRTGGQPDKRTVDRAYRFIREHEHDGLYIPPRLKPESAAFKTYHDQLPYDDDDAPSSDQGFHCGALIAAKELGYPVKDDEIAKAKAGYAKMFNVAGGYMATSLKQQNHIGQDSLYGEVLTYAVFGEKLLPDDVVKKHLETTLKIQSPYGMRVISNADGSLLEGHEGVYTNGGSWFLNDGANYLDGLIHGMDPQWVDHWTLWRLEKELAFMPAFHESISTVTGKPHGHHLYSWNSGYWWLRKEVRKRLNMTGDDPLNGQLDALLGVKRAGEFLTLEPGAGKLRPESQK